MNKPDVAPRHPSVIQHDINENLPFQDNSVDFYVTLRARALRSQTSPQLYERMLQGVKNYRNP